MPSPGPVGTVAIPSSTGMSGWTRLSVKGFSSTHHSWSRFPGRTALTCRVAAFRIPVFQACGMHHMPAESAISAIRRISAIPPAPGDVRLHDVHGSCVGELLEVPDSGALLACRDRQGRPLGELHVGVHLIGQEGFLEPAESQIAEGGCDIEGIVVPTIST